RWTITDSGIGIPTTAMGRLFEKFYRADNVHTVETEGTGLGLYLVRLIIERLAGGVWCESEEGRGSAFMFTLPISGRGRWRQRGRGSCRSKTTDSCGGLGRRARGNAAV